MIHTSSSAFDRFGELWASSATMESFQPDLENIIVALQSNRSLESISIGRRSRQLSAKAIRASFRSVKLAYVANVVGMGYKFNDIHTWGANDALSKTSNGIKVFGALTLKIGSSLGWSSLHAV
jgi:hypothetical protein